MRNLCKPDKPLIIVWIMPLVMLGERSILGKWKVIDRQYSQDPGGLLQPGQLDIRDGNKRFCFSVWSKWTTKRLERLFIQWLIFAFLIFWNSIDDSNFFLRIASPFRSTENGFCFKKFCCAQCKDYWAYANCFQFEDLSLARMVTALCTNGSDSSVGNLALPVAGSCGLWYKIRFDRQNFEKQHLE